jgi:hypothetical protein
MNLTTYFWQANVAWLLLYAVYGVFLRRDTFFRWNRFYLLGATLFALAFPFLPILPMFQDAVPEDQVLLFFGGNEIEIPVHTVAQTEAQTLLTWENSLLFTYILGVLFCAIRLIISFLTILKLIIKNGISRKQEGYFIVQTTVGTPVFSFLNILFWNEPVAVAETEKAKILAHELVHIRQWHTLDVLFMELMTVAFWCNPVAWAYRKSLQAVHEYLADAKVLDKGMSKTEYANLLVSQFLQTDTLYLTNHFLNKSLLKNRIMMIHQRKSTQKALVKFALAVPILAVCLFVAACSKELNNIQIAQFDIPKGFEVQQKYTLSANKEIWIDMDSSTSYMMRISNPRNNYQGIILTLYNSKNEEVAISKVNNRYFKGFTYRCKIVGKYRLLMTMEKGADEETVVAWAKRKNNEVVSNSKITYFPLDKQYKFAVNCEPDMSYNFFIESKEHKFKDYFLRAYRPDGKKIAIKELYEKTAQSLGFRVQKGEEGIYNIEVIPTKSNLPQGLNLSMMQGKWDIKEIEALQPSPKPEPSPFSGLKEYDAPTGKISEYTMVLAKNVTYSFRMMKGSAKLEIKDADGKVAFSAENGELVIKNVEKVGIYNLFITPRGSAEAKVALSLIMGENE